MAKTVIGLFDSHTDAENVVREITSIGVPRENVSVVANQNALYNGSTTVDTASGTTVSDGTATGSGITPGFVHGAEQGAIWGGIGGLVIGLAALAIPGFGPIVAAGPIAAALTGVGLGAATGGLIGSLSHLGVPEDDAHFYAEGVRRGSTLVTAQTDDEATAQRISDIMHNHNAVDIEERGSIYKQSGYTGSSLAPVYSATEIEAERTRYRTQPAATVNTTAANTATFNTATTPLNPGEITIPVVGEEPVVGMRAVEGGGAHVRTFVTENFEQTGINSNVNTNSNYAAYDTDFRNHYNTNYASTGESYDSYDPAYRYGHTLATDSRYSTLSNWNDVEAQGRSGWDISRYGAWDKFKDSVRHAWESTRNSVHNATR